VIGSRLPGVDGLQDSLTASQCLEDMLEDAPEDGVAIDWLLAHLFSRSPEILFLAFTPVAIVPATSPLAGALLIFIAIPLVFHRRSIFLPRFLTRHKIPPFEIEPSFKGLLRVLKRYEAYALRHQHLPTRSHTRLVGVLVTALGAMLLIPLPFSNVLPALAIGTVSFASLEQDGRLLILASLLTAISLLLVLMEAFSTYHLAAAFL
jgi:hypothetical protein